MSTAKTANAEVIARAREMERQGVSRSKIAATLGFTRAWVTKVLGARLVDSHYAAVIKTITVPAWVPRRLRDEYLAVAHNEDEFAAARWARAEKARGRAV